MTESELSALIKADGWMMRVLQAAAKVDLPEWWIGAGFLRNKIWNHLEGKDNERSRDVDLVYFNGRDVRPETDWGYDASMANVYSFAEWEIRNQARMHIKNGFKPFTSTIDGISHWTETATCIAVKLQDGELSYLFCYGTNDLYNLIARPTPYFASGSALALFDRRVKEKQWQEKWPHLKVVTTHQ